MLGLGDCLPDLALDGVDLVAQQLEDEIGVGGGEVLEILVALHFAVGLTDLRLELGGDHPPEARKLKNVIKLYQQEIDEEMDIWLKKHEAAWPKEIKKGMCFKWYVTGVVIEITSDAKKATNKNLQGDDAIYWEAKQQDGTPYSSVKKSALTPKNKWKFIKT